MIFAQTADGLVVLGILALFLVGTAIGRAIWGKA